MVAPLANPARLRAGWASSAPPTHGRSTHPSPRARTSRSELRSAHSPPGASDLVDVVLDELDLGGAVQVLLDDALRELDREIGDLALDVGHRPLGRGADVVRRLRADLGGVHLGPGDQVLAHLLGRLAGLLDDAPGLVARVGQLALVVGE